MQSGDIIGFSGHYWSSAIINLATSGIPFWSISHVGIISGGKLWEATAVGVESYDIDARLNEYKGKVWHYPLYRSLYRDEKRRLTLFLKKQVGKPYDVIGAIRAGDCLGLSWVESMLRRADLSSLFCSELCAAAHTHIGIFTTDHVGRWSPNKFVRTERRKGLLQKPFRLK